VSGAAALGALAAAQGVALVVLLRRLARGRTRFPSARPERASDSRASVTVVVPTRNESARLRPCLDGLRRQQTPLVEVIVVDGGSTDGTLDLIDAAARLDGRVRRIDEPPRPSGAVGRPWAIAAGCAAARAEWVMVVDADVAPRPGMVAGAVAAARRHGYDAVSFAPRIRAPGAGARWLQPAFLTTLVYRFGPVGVDTPPERAMANGQCLLVRRAVLERAGGYAVASTSYCDDVRIVRHLAACGARVGFLDGAALLDVEMYPDAASTWRGWPRSLNLRDATRPSWRWLDALFLLLAQALPLPVLLAALALPLPRALLLVNLLLLAPRFLLLAATAHSFSRRGLAYWLSPLADAAAVLRVVQTTIERPREWRGAPQREALSAENAAVL
jgi:dolichol-phosphate mannosyltransferase